MRVFVTNEIHPFTAGGIGRVIGNVLATSTPEELARTTIVTGASGVDEARCRTIYPGVHVRTIRPTDYREQGEDARRFPPASSFASNPNHLVSFVVMQTLVRLEHEFGGLDYVEFTDWAGSGFAAIQEKRLGLAFRGTTLAVRLHSTESVLVHFERRIASTDLYDTERKCLADCDVVVAQLPAIAAHVGGFFGFETSDWNARVHIHAPPVLLDEGSPVPRSIPIGPDTPIVFSSKIQELKRPDVFVRGCVGFLRRRPQYRGQVILIAHAFDEAYRSSIESLVPDDLRSRFLFASKRTQAERAATIATSVCVFSTAYESFCLAAYEASLAGAFCVVNGAALAFDDDSPWVDGENCAKFDGTSAGLASSLERLFADVGRDVSAVRPPVDPRPWDHRPSGPEATPASPRVSVVIPVCGDGSAVFRCVDSVLDATYPDVEVIVVDDASQDVGTVDALRSLDAMASDDLRVVRSDFPRGPSAIRNLGIESARGEVVVVLPPTCRISSEFLAQAAAALCRDPRFDFVVPQPAYVGDRVCSIEELGNAFLCEPKVGEALATGYRENSFTSPVLAGRRSAFSSFPYAESIDDEFVWEQSFRAAVGGARFVVTNSIECVVFEPERREVTNLDRAIAIHQVIRGKSATVGAVPMSLYPFEEISVDLVVVDDVVVAPTPAIPQSALARKTAKLMKDPARFFSDSSRGWVRRLRKVIR